MVDDLPSRAYSVRTVVTRLFGKIKTSSTSSSLSFSFSFSFSSSSTSTKMRLLLFSVFTNTPITAITAEGWVIRNTY